MDNFFLFASNQMKCKQLSRKLLSYRGAQTSLSLAPSSLQQMALPAEPWGQTASNYDIRGVLGFPDQQIDEQGQWYTLPNLTITPYDVLTQKRVSLAAVLRSIPDHVRTVFTEEVLERFNIGNITQKGVTAFIVQLKVHPKMMLACYGDDNVVCLLLCLIALILMNEGLPKPRNVFDRAMARFAALIAKYKRKATPTRQSISAEDTYEPFESLYVSDARSKDLQQIRQRVGHTFYIENEEDAFMELRTLWRALNSTEQSVLRDLFRQLATHFELWMACMNDPESTYIPCLHELRLMSHKLQIMDYEPFKERVW